MRNLLHDWFVQNRRLFPWREQPTPYTVWISEVMLQQTRASVVVSYFRRWMERFPNIKTLAEAPRETVIKLWEGLGYYSRARNLHVAAQQMMQQYGGSVPDSKQALASIRGIGPYTIGAILSFGFHQRAAAVDANIARVVSRIICLQENICKAAARRVLEDEVERLLDLQTPWITLEALIELGAQVCLPKPLCRGCPIQKKCLSFHRNLAHIVPIKDAKPKITSLARAVFVIESGSKNVQKRFLIHKCGKGKIMADLYEFPSFELECFRDDRHSICLFQAQIERMFGLKTQWRHSLPTVFHSFTRYRARLYPLVFRAVHAVDVSDWLWVSQEELLEFPFSAGHRKIAHQLSCDSI